MKVKIEPQARGTRILIGDEVRQRRRVLNQLITLAENAGFEEVQLPSIEPAEIYVDKAGPEILQQMYVFEDRKGRELCLRPEVTATVQLIADQHLRRRQDVKLWYFEKCWRYERPQEGRYREFLQFGLEILNPSCEYTNELIALAEEMIRCQTTEYVVNRSVARGLNYYVDNGFEITAPQLGAQQQILGGGAYQQGIGFAIGFDRLMLCH